MPSASSAAVPGPSSTRGWSTRSSRRTCSAPARKNASVLTLYDADRCPYCARVRIVLAEKGLAWETVAVDLDDRPAWIYEKNPLGRVPVLEEDGPGPPEAAVIMAYLHQRYPEPPLLPADAAER